jgi:hypothetical protein
MRSYEVEVDTSGTLRRNGHENKLITLETSGLNNLKQGA